MSVIAYDGKVVAADKQATCHGTQFRCTKIKMVEGGVILAVVGNLADQHALFAWYESGYKPADFPNAGKSIDSNFSSMIAITPDGKVLEWQIHAIPIVHDTSLPLAWGSGRDNALGAMYAGARAREAVEIACKLDAHCGMGVDVIERPSSNVSGRA